MISGPECKVCGDPRVGDIHRALDAGGGVNETARGYGFPPTTLKRHLRHRAPGPSGPVASPSPVHDADRPTPPPVRQRQAAPVQPEEDAGPSSPRRPSVPDGDLPLDDLEGRLHQLARTADGLRRDAEEGTLRERGAALGEARRTVESMHKIHEALAESRELRMIESDEWATLRGRVLEVLAPFPPARAALLEAMRAYEDA